MTTMYKGYDLEKVAQRLHEALSKTSEVLGQGFYAPWESAEDWQKASSHNTSRTVIDNPTAGPGVIWHAWVAEGESLANAFRRLPWAEQIKDYVALVEVLEELRAQDAVRAAHT